MHEIYILPTCVAVAAAVLVIFWARRGRHNLLTCALVGGVAGFVAWYVTLLASVVIMIPAGAHG